MATMPGRRKSIAVLAGCTRIHIAMSSLGRMLGILDLYTEAEPARSIDNLVARTGYTRPTLYRYVRELGKAGLLVKITRNLYVLGPRFIEIDRQIRASDPLLKVGQPLVSDLFREDGATVILCGLLRDSVMCIHRQSAPDVPDQLGHDRGRAMPLFLTASAKAILAFLPSPRLRRLFQSRRVEIRSARLGRNWEGFKEKRRAIRRSGYAESHGELVPGLAGIAVPIFNPERDVLGSVAFVIPERKLTEERKEFLVAVLKKGAQRMNDALARLGTAQNGGARRRIVSVEHARRRAKPP